MKAAIVAPQAGAEVGQARPAAGGLHAQPALRPAQSVRLGQPADRRARRDEGPAGQPRRLLGPVATVGRALFGAKSWICGWTMPPGTKARRCVHFSRPTTGGFICITTRPIILNSIRRSAFGDGFAMRKRPTTIMPARRICAPATATTVASKTPARMSHEVFIQFPFQIAGQSR